MANVAQQTIYTLRQEVEAKFDRLPLKFFDSRTRGEVMSRAVNDLDSISSTLQQNLTQLLTSALTLIGVIVMMLTISWILTLVIVLTLPLSIVIVARIAKRSQKFFMTNQTQVDTFVATMKEVARYAEKFGVVVAVEDWISAEENIRLLDAIGSDHVAVYYDAHNIVPRVRDIYAEPKLLGPRIHQIHVKNANLLLSAPGGRVDWPRMATEFYDIGYRGWYVLETDSPTKDIIADTRANIEYVKKTFRVPPPPAS